jgi:hypothetical protein
MKILAISGSGRTASTITALLRTVSNIAEPDHHQVTVFPASPIPVFTPDCQAVAAAHAAIQMLLLRPVRMRLATIIQRYHAPCDGIFSQTIEQPGLATGNIPAARLTQPHTRLKWLRVRSSCLPWNAALSSPRCGRVRDRLGAAARRAVIRR